MSSTGPSIAGTTEMLRHNKIDLALHHLRDPIDDGRPLLLLHGLGECASPEVPGWAAAWPGQISALDFTGHGSSTIPRAGGYTAEILLGDADTALSALTEDDPTMAITLAGRGLGAYIALQLAGARAEQVRGTVLLDGPGLLGGPGGPTSQGCFRLTQSNNPPDAYALDELGRDPRPADYAALFVRLALTRSGLDEPVAVSAIVRPEWLEAVAREQGVMEVPPAEALAVYGAIPS